MNKQRISEIAASIAAAIMNAYNQTGEIIESEIIEDVEYILDKETNT